MAKTKVKKKKTTLVIDNKSYNKAAKVVCSCGAHFEVGSTLNEINVEVCSRCHPFYTGTQKLVDTSGRVDKFKSRLEKQAMMAKKNVKVEKTIESTKENANDSGKDTK